MVTHVQLTGYKCKHWVQVKKFSQNQTLFWLSVRQRSRKWCQMREKFYLRIQFNRRNIRTKFVLIFIFGMKQSIQTQSKWQRIEENEMWKKYYQNRPEVSGQRKRKHSFDRKQDDSSDRSSDDKRYKKDKDDGKPDNYWLKKLIAAEEKLPNERFDTDLSSYMIWVTYCCVWTGGATTDSKSSIVTSSSQASPTKVSLNRSTRRAKRRRKNTRNTKSINTNESDFDCHLFCNYRLINWNKHQIIFYINIDL